MQMLCLKDATTVPGETRSSGMSRPNFVSPGEGAEVPGTKDRRDMADRRRCSDCRANGRPGCFGFSSCRYGRPAAKGAPLVPYLDYLLFRDPNIGRIVQNIGGIANLTAIPAGAELGEVLAFDTGPGNMVMDAVTDALFGRAFDRSGKIAASGMVIEPYHRDACEESSFERSLRRPRGERNSAENSSREFLTQVRPRSQGRRRGDSDGVDGAIHR